MTSWVVVLATSALAVALKWLGHVVPERWLANARVQRINALVPIVLLSALVVAESVVQKSRLVVDHRVAGLAAAVVALLLRAPFPVVVLTAALTSAAVVHWH